MQNYKDELNTDTVKLKDQKTKKERTQAPSPLALLMEKTNQVMCLNTFQNCFLNSAVPTSILVLLPFRTSYIC